MEAKNVQDMLSVKARYAVPPTLQACHTAIVDGYVIEGHVPAAEIERLLAERLDISGLAVPGMPAGSPGMPAHGTAPVSFDVIAFDQSGRQEVYASYNK